MWNIGTDSLRDGGNHLGLVWSKGTLGHTYSRVAVSPRGSHESRGALQARSKPIPTVPIYFGESALRVARLGWKLRTVSNPGGGATAAVSGKWLGTLAPTTAWCKIGFVGLLRDGSRCPWADPNVPSPGQA
ncbi:hypothetical protein CRG98_019637 [Punica granatum]|uniref:Uncharacterized protein n=1 Tax=Punica granatum TaxID=22663 RepID=A0A2I0JVR4_PUNGR|nr:hypothetical protein CRG98_019637 [Punica granatum]